MQKVNKTFKKYEYMQTSLPNFLSNNEKFLIKIISHI